MNDAVLYAKVTTQDTEGVQGGVKLYCEDRGHVVAHRDVMVN